MTEREFWQAAYLASTRAGYAHIHASRRADEAVQAFRLRRGDDPYAVNLPPEEK